jgi:hypothetical protein
MIDDVLYFSTPSNRIIALDAGTGREIWQFDPQVRHPGPRQFHKHRGVAYWQNESASDRRILFGSLRRTIDRSGCHNVCAGAIFPVVPCQVYLTGKETEPWEIIYFKLYKSQLPVVEQALETTALMLGSDKSRGYCLEMICADFLAGSVSEENQSEVLVLSLVRLYQTLPHERKLQLAERIKEGPWGACVKSGRA